MRLESIAEAPEIVTPIGLAIDQEDALYVLESHTHLAYEDYPGPAYDRVKKGIDENGDGIPEQWITFADSHRRRDEYLSGLNGQIICSGKGSGSKLC